MPNGSNRDGLGANHDRVAQWQRLIYRGRGEINYGRLDEVCTPEQNVRQ
jgi:hypothetical protein